MEFLNSNFDAADTMLLGKKSADGFINHWENTVISNSAHPFAKKIAEMPKVVLTNTPDESTWNNAVLAKGNLAEEIAELKDRDG